VAEEAFGEGDGGGFTGSAGVGGEGDFVVAGGLEPLFCVGVEGGEEAGVDGERQLVGLAGGQGDSLEPEQTQGFRSGHRG